MKKFRFEMSPPCLSRAANEYQCIYQLRLSQPPFFLTNKTHMAMFITLFIRGFFCKAKITIYSAQNKVF